ncbi:hypothetical protein Tco_0820459 [Tanacetum coccineum]|uniref:Uncharacterized protein n=1 Tax=Tanacetum coccineum TaxID=301880 RepID=A0ABQ5A9H9_9ASTR
MSSDNASSIVTYMSISSYSNGLSWGIPLVNASELPKMDPYEEVAQQGQAPPLSPAYVPDRIGLDEHVPVEDQPYADDTSPTAESPGYIADLDSMKEDTDEDSIDYLDKPEDDDEDPEEDNDEDPRKEHKPEDEDTKEEEPSEGSDETEPFKEDETAALIDAFSAGSPPFQLPPTSPAYDQAPLGHRAAMIRMRDNIPEEDMPARRRFVLTTPLPGCDIAESFAAAARAPRGQYDFVDTIEAGQGLIRSPGHDAQTITRAADRAEDVGYVRALQASKHRMMTSIEEVNLRVSYQAQIRRRESEDFYTQLLDARTDRIDIRLEIDVNKALLARIETLKIHISRMEWQCQSAEDRAVKQMIRTQVLEARTWIDMLEDAGSGC